MQNERPPECTMRLRVAGHHWVCIPSVDERYHFKPGKEYWFKPLALVKMMRIMKRRLDRQAYYGVLSQLLIDKPGEWEIGGLYVLRGLGIMRLANVSQGEGDSVTLKFITPGTLCDYWASVEDVYHPATKDDIKAHCEGLRRVGSDKGADQIEAWAKEGS